MTTSDQLLPRSSLPRACFPASVRLAWFDMDTIERYRENGGHPRYGEGDIQYEFNSLGYRCPEFERSAALRVVAVGCSDVMGVGLPQSELFHQRFGERLRAHTGRPVVVWNLGCAGGSNDYINRILQLAVPLLEPDAVLVNFTRTCRREYVSVENRVVRYNPGWHPTSAIDRKIKSHFDGLSSPYDDQFNLFRNYQAIAGLLSHRRWVFSTSDPEGLEAIIEHVDSSRYVGALKVVDNARDHLHPGAESHANLAARYWERYLSLGHGSEHLDPPAPAASTHGGVTPGPQRGEPAPPLASGEPTPSLGWLGRRSRDFVRFVAYQLRSRARLKRVRNDDPNIYPLW